MENNELIVKHLCDFLHHVEDTAYYNSGCWINKETDEHVLREDLAKEYLKDKPITGKAKKVVSKGFTITVKSWENDGDNYQTNSITVNTLEEATAWVDMMQLCRSANNQPKGEIYFGNLFEDEFTKEHQRIAADFIIENYEQLSRYLNEDIQLDADKSDKELSYVFMNLAAILLGNSEYYACRVMQDCSVTHSSEDVYCEEIVFN